MSESTLPVIGFILKGYPRISESFISNEILLLEKHGFSIHIFSMRHPREDFCHDSVKQIKASVDYLPSSILLFLPGLIYHNVLLAIKRPFLYIKSLRIAFRRFLRTYKSATLKHLLQAGYLVHRFLPDKQVEHLHAHFAHSPTSVAMFASHLSGLPFSFTAHAKDIYTSHKRQLREKISLARFVVTCTGYNQKYLTNISQDKVYPIHRIYHGIDTTLFSPNNSRSKLSPPYRILTVARLAPKKGLPTVLKAIQHLVNMGFSIRHTLIGDGDDRDEILSLIQKLNLQDVCQWIGSQPHEVVLEQYNQADLFVLGCEIAENGDRDGIPNVFLESMAMGVPVVATKISAIPELIIDGKTGLLVPAGSPKKMAQAMARLLTENDLRDKIITEGKDLVNQRFNNKALIGDLVALFRKIGM